MQPTFPCPKPMPWPMRPAGTPCAPRSWRGRVRASWSCSATPGWGYCAGASKFGGSGDFTTAPELGRPPAGSVANALAPVFAQLGAQARMLELGGGTGAFAEAVPLRLAELDALPPPRAILEPSADLRAPAAASAAEPAGRAGRARGLGRPPVRRGLGRRGVRQRGDRRAADPALPDPRWRGLRGTVELDAEGTIRGAQPADPAQRCGAPYRALPEKPFAEGYRSEVLPQLPYWLQAVAGGMQRVRCCSSTTATVAASSTSTTATGHRACVYRHHVHNDVHRWPGLQDITASVDFTAMAEAGMHGGFELAGYCSQASFLLGNGLDQVLLLAEERTDEVGRIQLRDQVKKLTLPTEMGERFQAIGLQRGVDFEPAFVT